MRIRSPPGVLVRAMRSLAASPSRSMAGLVELEHVTLGVGHDDGLEDGLQDGVAELEFHLAAAGLGVAKIAKADGHAVELGADRAEFVLRAPLDALLQISLRD